MQEAGHIVRRVAESSPPRRGGYRVGDARVGRGGGLCHVFEPVAGHAAAGPDRDRRVPHDVEPAVRFPQGHAAVGKVGRRRDADGDVDGDVAAERGGRLVQADVRRSRAGRVVPGRHGEDERRVPGDPGGQGGEEEGDGGDGVGHGETEVHVLSCFRNHAKKANIWTA